MVEAQMIRDTKNLVGMIQVKPTEMIPVEPSLPIRQESFEKLNLYVVEPKYK